MRQDIQRKCEQCLPSRMSGKNIKPNIYSTEQKKLPALDNPNEEIQLNYIGPITDKHLIIYILLSIDRCSKWPAASLTNNPNGTTAVKFLEQYIRLNGTPKIIKKDKAKAFSGKSFRVFFQSHDIKIIYGTLKTEEIAI